MSVARWSSLSAALTISEADALPLLISTTTESFGLVAMPSPSAGQGFTAPPVDSWVKIVPELTNSDAIFWAE